MALQSRITVYVAIAGVLSMMGGIIYYASLDNVDLAQVEIQLTSVELIEVDTTNDQAKFNVTFLVKNPSDKTFTVSLIDYELYGNGILLGPGQYSTLDISMPGRASFFAGTEIPLENIFILSKSDVSPEIYQSTIENGINNFEAKGMITTESTWSIGEKEFETGYFN